MSSNFENLIIQQNELIEILVKEVSGPNLIEPLVIGLVIAFSGAFAAYCFNRIHWKLTEQEKARVHYFSSLHSLISQLEDLGLRYWLKDAGFDSEEELEIRIKSIHRTLTSRSKVFSCFKPDTSKEKRIKKFCSDIYDTITGDEFESSSRRRSKSKANSIARQCTTIKSMINELARVE